MFFCCHLLVYQHLLHYKTGACTTPTQVKAKLSVLNYALNLILAYALQLKSPFKMNRSYSIKSLAIGLCLISAFCLHAQNFKLVKDINVQTNSIPRNATNTSTSYAVLNGKTYFAADDGVHGQELWSSDGTSAGTKLAVDIYPGATGSGVNYIYTFNNKLYFFAANGWQFVQFWQSDGTEAGTKILVDSLPVIDATPVDPPSYAVVNNTLYFTVTNLFDNEEVWKTDGTRAGTIQLVNLYSQAQNFTYRAADFNPLNGKLFFTAGFGAQLWVTDGTVAGTHKFIYNGSNATDNYFNFATVNNKLYFRHNNGLLWETNGNPDSTRLITTPGGIVTLTNFKNQLFAVTLQFNQPYYLQKYMPATGFQVIKQLNKGSNGYIGSFVQNEKDSLLYFTTVDSAVIAQLWVTDGTAAGTKFLAGGNGNFSNFCTTGSKVLFSYTGNDKGEELWMTNGRASGTKMLKDINTGGYGSSPSSLTTLDTATLFMANNVANGIELWKTDGTATGTALLKDINTTATAGSEPSLTPGFYDTLNNHLIFTASDGIHDNQVWSSDATASGTFLTAVTYPNTDFTPIRLTGSELSTQFKGEEYFYSRSPINNFQLWKTKGLPNTTGFVSNVFTSPNGIIPEKLGATPNYLFAIIDPYQGYRNLQYLDSLGDRLYVYNGTGDFVLLKKGFVSAFARGVYT